jgi:hypothetical protein
MKVDAINVALIKELFAKMQTTEELLYLLNFTNKSFYGDNAKQFTLQQLTYFANPKRSKNCYLRFTIKKKSGAERQIHAPNQVLKSIQKAISLALQCVYKPSPAAYGFIWNKSVVENARKHFDSRYVFNIDLKDFFESIDQARVWKCFQLEPFSLNEKTTSDLMLLRSDVFMDTYFADGNKPVWHRIGRKIITNTKDGVFYLADYIPEAKALVEDAKTKIPPLTTGGKLKLERWFINRKPDFTRQHLANILASICCTELMVERMDKHGSWKKVQRKVLPQGAPTSPVITNIVCQRLDYLLTGVANRFGLRYTRYADDITFSSQHNVYQKNGEFITELHRVIADQGFHIKESKTRLQKDGHRKEVTGLLVHEKVNVQSRYIKQIRMWLYYWERYGLEKAQFIFTGQYDKDKGHIKKAGTSIVAVTGGKLEYLKMVKGSTDSVYLALSDRYQKLLNPVAKQLTDISRINYLNNVLNVLLANGLDSAMDIYNPENANQNNIILTSKNILVVLGITNNIELNAAKIKYKDNPNILKLLEEIVIGTNAENKKQFDDVSDRIERSKENVRLRLIKLPEYNCSNWYEISKTTIGGVYKNGVPIELVVRPGDGNKILLFYDEEFKVLEKPSNELWYDTGNIQNLYTFGTFLKIADVKQLPIKL